MRLRNYRRGQGEILVMSGRSGKHHSALDRLEDRLLLAAHVVGDPTLYATIQAAVNAAAVGATINVDAGLYPELVTITKSLLIRGAQATVDARASSRGVAGSEAVLTGANLGDGSYSSSFYIAANDVTLDGFTIQGNTNSGQYGAGIVIAPNQSGTHILNNILQHNIAGLFLANANPADPAVIQHNLFYQNNNPGWNTGRGIYSDAIVSGGTLTNVLIDANTFRQNYGSVPSTGMEAAISFESTLPLSQSNITITNNNILDGNGKAVLMWNASGVLIQNNSITDTADNESGTLRFEGGMRDVTIKNNILWRNFGPAVRIDNKGAAGDNSNFTITYNNFANNGAGLVVNTNHYVGVINAQYNWWGNASGPSGDGAGTGDSVIVTPAAPSHLSATVVSASQINLAWSRNSSNETSSVIERSFDGLTFTQVGTVPAGATLYSDNGLVANTTYYYRVLAVNLAGDSTYSNTVHATAASVPAPTAPSNLVATAAAATQINLAWSDNAGNETGFQIERSLDAVTFTPIALTSANATTYADAGLTAGALYSYRVRAVNPTGSSGYTVTASATALAPLTAPNSPSNLQAAAYSATQINLTWTRNSSNETACKIERSLDGAVFTPLPNVPAGATSYLDTGLASATRYYYRLRATNGAGDSGYSNIATATTDPSPNLVLYSPWSATPLAATQFPFYGVPFTVGAPIPIADFDNGGENVAYHDTDASNLGGQYRPEEGVDIEAAGSASTMPYDVGWVKTGEWLEYTLNVPTAGPYTLSLSLASSGVGGTFHVEIGGVDRTGSIRVPNTGDWHTWQLLSVPVSLTAGPQILHLAFDTNGAAGFVGNFSWLSLTPLTAPPAAPSNLIATATSASQINLAWTDNASNETGFQLERSLDGVTFAQIATISPNVTTYTDTTLSSETAYYYRLRATNASGNSPYTNTASATTTPLYLSTLPWTSATVGWGTVHKDASIKGTTLTLNGVTYTKGIGTHAASQIVYTLAGQYTGFRSDIGVDDEVGNNGSVVFQVLADGVKVFDSGTMTGASPTQSINLSLAGVNQLTLVVTNGGNTIDYDHADWAGARLLNLSTTLPLAPSALTATAVSASQINLAWTDNATNETGFQLERSLDGVTFAQIAMVGPNVTTYADLTLAPATTYSYRLRATNAAGSSSYTNLANATTAVLLTVPAAPSNLLATPVSASQIDLAWTRNSSNEAGFKIERSLDGITFAQIALAPAAAVSYQDTALVGSTLYYYRLCATNAAGDSNYSEIAAALTPAQVTAPAAPSNLVATAASASQINLAWTDNATNETGFQLERSLDGAAFALIATLGSNITTYTDTALAASSLYYYRLRATNTAGASAYTSPTAATTLAANVVTTSLSTLSWTSATVGWGTVQKNASIKGTTLTLNGSTYTQGLGTHAISQIVYNLAGQYAGFLADIGIDDEVGAAGSVVFQVLADGLKIFDSGVVTGASPTQSLNLNISGVTQLTLLATDAGDDIDHDHADWADARLTLATNIPPLAPSALTATAVSASQINLAWTDNASNETGFQLERSLDGAAFALIATVGPNITTYADTALAASSLYYYRLRAVNTAGASAYTSPATATTLPATAVTTYLSALSWTSATVGWSTVQKDASIKGTPLTLNGATYTKGLGTHATSQIVYNLAGKYASFLTDIGLDDEVGSNGSVVFQVWADGIKLYDSGTMTGASATQSLNLSVKGVNQLTLLVTDAGDGLDYDHADWAGARLISA